MTKIFNGGTVAALALATSQAFATGSHTPTPAPTPEKSTTTVTVGQGQQQGQTQQQQNNQQQVQIDKSVTTATGGAVNLQTGAIQVNGAPTSSSATIQSGAVQVQGSTIQSGAVQNTVEGAKIEAGAVQNNVAGGAGGAGGSVTGSGNSTNANNNANNSSASIAAGAVNNNIVFKQAKQATALAGIGGQNAVLPADPCATAEGSGWGFTASGVGIGGFGVTKSQAVKQSGDVYEKCKIEKAQERREEILPQMGGAFAYTVVKGWENSEPEGSALKGALAETRKQVVEPTDPLFKVLTVQPAATASAPATNTIIFNLSATAPKEQITTLQDLCVTQKKSWVYNDKTNSFECRM